MKKLTSSWAKRIFALLVFALLLYFVDPKELVAAFKNLTIISIFYLLFISVVLIFVSAMKWKLFIEVLTKDISEVPTLLRLFSLYLLGYFVNLLLPSYVGGDLVRSAYVGRSIGQHEALAATVLERYTGLVAMIILALCCMWFTDLVTWQIKLAILVVAIGLFVATLVALMPSLSKKLAWMPGATRILPHFDKVQAALHYAKTHTKVFVQALLLSFVYHSLTVLNTLAAGAAVGWFDIPIGELFVVLPLILLIGSLPVSPNGLGIQEGAFVYFLQGIGASPAQALGLALVLRAKSYVLALFGGIVWMFQTDKRLR